MADELRLNSVDRFRKKSERLVLEEHSHCEVPAGCGGVVLRWCNPYALQSAILWFFPSLAKCFFLDAQTPARGRVDFTIGQHVLGFALENVDLASGLLLFAAHSETKNDGVSASPEVRKQTVRVLSTDDGTWLYTLDKPAEEWMSLAFDDSDWHPLVQRTTPQLENGHQGAHACERCVALGAVCLGLPVPSGQQVQLSWWQRFLGRQLQPHEPVQGNIWIRKVFEVIAPPDALEPKP